MTSKCSPSAAIAVSVACLLLAVGPRPLPGQAPTPSPSPAFKPRMGNVRLWNMQPIGSPNVELVVGSDPQGHALQNAPPINYYAGYLQLPPGTYPLNVFQVGNRQVPLKSFNAVLRPDSYVTILVAQGADNAPTATLIEDTPDPAKPTGNQVTVHQVCPNVKVQLTTSSGASTDTLEPGRSQTLTNLPNGLVSLFIRTTLADGTVRTFNAEADFRASRRASLLLFTDPYGRVRPRVSIDGPSPTEEEAAAKGQAPSAANR